VLALLPPYRSVAFVAGTAQRLLAAAGDDPGDLMNWLIAHEAWTIPVLALAIVAACLATVIGLVLGIDRWYRRP
jgi:hypothetical protein